MAHKDHHHHPAEPADRAYRIARSLTAPLGHSQCDTPDAPRDDPGPAIEGSSFKASLAMDEAQPTVSLPITRRYRTARHTPLQQQQRSTLTIAAFLAADLGG